MVLLVPIAAGVGIAAVLSRAIPRPPGGQAILWWAGLFAASAVTAWTVDRVARRLLPLAVLLQLTMLFPDRAPSRFAVARKVGTTKGLEERIRRAREAGEEDDPTQAAVRILELVAGGGDEGPAGGGGPGSDNQEPPAAADPAALRRPPAAEVAVAVAPAIPSGVSSTTWAESSTTPSTRSRMSWMTPWTRLKMSSTTWASRAGPSRPRG